jgi:hypothetical protein
MNKLNDELNQDINTVFDTFDHAYGKWAGRFIRRYATR